MRVFHFLRLAEELRLAERRTEAGHSSDAEQEARARFDALVAAHPQGVALGSFALALIDNEARLKLLGIFLVLWFVGAVLPED